MENNPHVSRQGSADIANQQSAQHNPLDSRILREQSREHLLREKHIAYHQPPAFAQPAPLAAYAYNAYQPSCATPQNAYIGAYQSFPAPMATSPQSFHPPYGQANAQPYFAGVYGNPSPYATPQYAYHYAPAPLAIPAVYYARPGSVFQAASPLQDLAKVIKRKLFGSSPLTKSGLSAKTWLNVRKAQRTLQQNWQQEKTLGAKPSRQEQATLKRQSEAEGIDVLFPASPHGRSEHAFNDEAFNFESLLGEKSQAEKPQIRKQDKKGLKTVQSERRSEGGENIRSAFDLYAAEEVMVGNAAQNSQSRVMADFVYDYAELPIPMVYQQADSQPVAVSAPTPDLAQPDPVFDTNEVAQVSQDSMAPEVSSEASQSPVESDEIVSGKQAENASNPRAEEFGETIAPLPTIMGKSIYFDKTRTQTQNTTKHASATNMPLSGSAQQALDSLFEKPHNSIELELKISADNGGDNEKTMTSGFLGKMAGVLKTCFGAHSENNNMLKEAAKDSIRFNSVRVNHDILSLGALREQAKVVLKDALQTATMSNEALDRIDTDAMWEQYQQLENRARAQKQMVNGLLDIGSAFGEEKLAYGFLSELPEYDPETLIKVSEVKTSQEEAQRETTGSIATLERSREPVDITDIKNAADRALETEASSIPFYEIGPQWQGGQIQPVGKLALSPSDLSHVLPVMARADVQNHRAVAVQSIDAILPEASETLAFISNAAIGPEEEIVVSDNELSPPEQPAHQQPVQMMSAEMALSLSEDIDIPEDDTLEIFEDVTLFDFDALALTEAASEAEAILPVEIPPYENVIIQQPLIDAEEKAPVTQTVAAEDQPEEFTFQSMLRNNHILSRSISTLASRYFENSEADQQALLYELLD